MALKARFEAKASEHSPKDLELEIYDVIGPDDALSMMIGDRVSAKSIKAKLAEFPDAENVKIRMNSGGGDVIDGTAIYTALSECKAKVTCQIDGICASIASVIAMAADEIVMSEGAWMMIHEPYSQMLVDQRADDLENMATALKKMGESMATIYSARTGQEKDSVLAAMKATTWMTAADAKALGYCNTIIPAKKGGNEDNELEMTAANMAALLREIPRIPAGACMAMARASQGTNPMAVKQSPRASDLRTAAIVAEASAASAEETVEEEESIDALKAKNKDLEAKLAEFEKKEADAKAKAEEGGDEEETEAKAQAEAIVAAAMAITGEKVRANLEGALYALEMKIGKPADAKAERSKLVSRLIADGKLAPARKEWALKASATSLDAYLAGIGEQRIAPIGVEHEPNDEAALALAAPKTKAKTLPEEEVIARGLGLTTDQIAQARAKRIERFGA